MNYTYFQAPIDYLNAAEEEYKLYRAALEHNDFSVADIHKMQSLTLAAKANELISKRIDTLNNK